VVLAETPGEASFTEKLLKPNNWVCYRLLLWSLPIAGRGSLQLAAAVILQDPSPSPASLVGLVYLGLFFFQK
jgi:hypothetical protein